MGAAGQKKLGVNAMKQFNISAGQRTRIIHHQFSSFPMEYRFSVEAADSAHSFTGQVEVRSTKWVFPRPAQMFPLQADNLVSAGY